MVQWPVCHFCSLFELLRTAEREREREKEEGGGGCRSVCDVTLK